MGKILALFKLMTNLQWRQDSTLQGEHFVELLSCRKAILVGGALGWGIGDLGSNLGSGTGFLRNLYKSPSQFPIFQMVTMLLPCLIGSCESKKIFNDGEVLGHDDGKVKLP